MSKKRISFFALLLLIAAFCMISLVSCDILNKHKENGDVEESEPGEEITCVHEWEEWTTVRAATCLQTGIKERICYKCFEEETLITDTVGHSGGEATCTQRARCDECGAEYGEIHGHSQAIDDGDCTTAILCSFCNDVLYEGREAHVGGSATCSSKARCTVCNKEYGEAVGHVPNADDNECTTAVFCSVCGIVTTEGNNSHVGGNATCTSLAKCSVCSKEYGELEPHSEDTVWIKRLDVHYLAYICCYSQASEAEAHNIVKGGCSICGFKPTISTSDLEVIPGETGVDFEISVSDNPGITGLMVTLEYNEDVFILRGAESGEALKALEFTAPSQLKNGCVFLWDGVEIKDEDIKNGDFLILTFDISDDAPEGVHTILLKISAYDNELNPFTMVIEGGSVTIKND